MIRLVASDLDGTIIAKNNYIDNNNLKAIKDLNNHNMKFVICTGKTYPITKNICSKFDASYGIFGNGSQIIDLKTGKEIYRNFLSKEEILSCIDIAREHNTHIHLYSGNQVITEKLMYLDLRNYKSPSSSDMEFIIVEDIKQYVLDNTLMVCKLVITSDFSTKDISDEIQTVLDVSTTTIRKFGEYKDFVLDKEYEYLDITQKNVSKDIALQFLGDYLNIKSSEMLTVGDNLNDFDMVKNAGVGVAVSNAYDELKQVASYITAKPVEKGAFAEAVYKFIDF